MEEDIFSTLLHLGAIFYPLDNLLKMNVICMEVTAHHIQLQVAHRNMWNSILPVNLRMRSWENDFRHTLKIICVIQYLHLADEGFCYLVLSLFFCGKY